MAKHRLASSGPRKDDRARIGTAAALLAGAAALAAPAVASSVATAAPSTAHLSGDSSNTKDEAFAFFGWSSIFDASWDPHWGPHRKPTVWA